MRLRTTLELNLLVLAVLFSFKSRCGAVVCVGREGRRGGRAPGAPTCCRDRARDPATNTLSPAPTARECVHETPGAEPSVCRGFAQRRPCAPVLRLHVWDGGGVVAVRSRRVCEFARGWSGKTEAVSDFGPAGSPRPPIWRAVREVSGAGAVAGDPSV